MLAEIRDTVSLLPYARHVAQVNINCRFILLRRLIFRTRSNLRKFYDTRTGTELDLRISWTNFKRFLACYLQSPDFIDNLFAREPLNLTVATESAEKFYNRERNGTSCQIVIETRIFSRHRIQYDKLRTLLQNLSLSFLNVLKLDMKIFLPTYMHMEISIVR